MGESVGTWLRNSAGLEGSSVGKPDGAVVGGDESGDFALGTDVCVLGVGVKDGDGVGMEDGAGVGAHSELQEGYAFCNVVPHALYMPFR